MEAVEVSTWTGLELEAVVAEAKRYARTLAKTDTARANQILLRGAALHGDIARLIPEDTVRKSPTQRTAYIVRDGRWLGIRYISVHWQLGRSLLDGITPDPATNPDVKTWYQEIAAHLLQMRQFAAAVDHFARARQMFPSDPDILFSSGVSARAVWFDGASGCRGVGHRVQTRGCIRQLARAASSYAPSASSARRSRTGRTISKRGCAMAACSTICNGTTKRRKNSAVAIAGGASGWLLYLAELFLGRAEEARGDHAASRAAFLRASALYPNAQSPRLALSQIARRTGDRAAAQRELQFIAALPDDERRREDPWWLYYDVR